MIIVCEGPDNCGKTTFALDLSKRLKACFVKAERPRRGISLVHYMETLRAAEAYAGICVTDRHVAISEPIYGKIIRGGHELPEELITKAWASIHAIVYCRPPTAAVIASISERPQMEGVVEHTQELLNAYDEVFEGVHIDQEILLHHYDYTTDPTAEKVAKFLADYREAHNL